MGEAIERALQRYSRHQALAYIGICGPSDGPYNEHAAQMVEDWTHTYETVLSQQQREVHGLLGNYTLVSINMMSQLLSLV